MGNILMIQFDLDQGLETDARKYEDAVAIARLLVARGARVTDEHADFETLWFCFHRSIDGSGESHGGCGDGRQHASSPGRQVESRDGPGAGRKGGMLVG